VNSSCAFRGNRNCDGTIDADARVGVVAAFFDPSTGNVPLRGLQHERGTRRSRRAVHPVRHCAHFFIGLVGSVALSATLLATAVGARQQLESSVACNEATEPLRMVYGQYATGCAIDQPTDLDRFVVAAGAGDTLRTTLQSLTNGLDPCVEIRDPLGAVVGTQCCSGDRPGLPPIRCALLFDVGVVTTGDHQLAVSDSGADDTGGYVLQIERIPPVPSLPVLPYNLAVVDRVDPQTDRDCMAWEATAGTNVRMTLRSHTDGFDPEIQVVDPTGVTVTTKSCSGDRSGLPPIQCTVQTDLTPTLSGTYTLCIRDTGADDVGDYEINLQCLFGTCTDVSTSSTTTTSSSTTSTTTSTSTTSSTVPTTSTTMSTTTTTATTTSLTVTSTTVTTTSLTTPTTLVTTTTTRLPTTTTRTSPPTTTTSTEPLRACQQLVCGSTGCASAPGPDGTACDDGDGCGPDACKAGACVNNALCTQTVAEQQQAPDSGKPVTAVAVRCSVEGAIGFCAAQGFVTRALVDEILPPGKGARAAAAYLQPTAVGDDAEVPVTKKARARFDRFGIARFSLKLNPLGRRLLKRATKLGRAVPVDIRFTVMDGNTTRELRRLVQLVQGRR